jgi:antitoxin component YwqK of YwqJK toxin-antitoxin module
MPHFFRHFTLLFFTGFLMQPFIYGQKTLNQFDNQGNRHGKWIEYFNKNDKLPKFEGEFIHGKETGVFKFYQKGFKQPTAVMTFDPESDTVSAKYLSQNGKTISEGQIVEKKKIGLWTYFHKNRDKIMMTENYRDGKLHGLKRVFYEDGVLAEEANYNLGELHGNRKLYSVKGVVLEDLTYVNGELHGPAKFYNGKGELMSEGIYKNDKHHGTWRYYENGKLKEEKEY